MDPASYRVALGRSRSEEDKMIFYVDDFANYHGDYRKQFEPPRGLYYSSSGKKPRRSNSVCAQSDKSRKSRHSQRRSSMQAGKSRTNSCPRPTPLGDGRRASITRKSSSTRRASTHGSIHCKQSLKQGKLETQEAQLKKIIDKTLRDDAQARRHRRIASIVIGTFFILLAASVLVVIVTLTQSSFHAPQIGDRELAHHRAHHSHFLNFKNNNSFRKENEELINSLNRDPPVPVNNT